MVIFIFFFFYLLVDLVGGQRLPWEAAEWLWSSGRSSPGITAAERGGSEVGSPRSPHFRTHCRTLLCHIWASCLCSPCPRGRGTAFLQGIRSVCTQSARQGLGLEGTDFPTALLVQIFLFFSSEPDLLLAETILAQLAKCQRRANWVISAAEVMGGGCAGQSGGLRAAAGAQLRPLYPPCLPWQQNPTCFRKTSKNMGRGIVWWDAKANTTAPVPTSRIPPATTPVLPGGKAQQHPAPSFSIWRVFSPVSSNSSFLPLCLSGVFADRTELLLANTLFIVIECLVITLYIFSILKLKPFTSRNRC